MLKAFMMSACLIAACGCRCSMMVQPTVKLNKGEVYEYSWYNRRLVVCQVVETNLVHAYAPNAKRVMRIAIQPLVDDYVTGQYVTFGKYEYVGSHMYMLLKDGLGNDHQTNTIRLFKEIK